jgi:steroid delta-isomerase-like uncharacterized protein
MSQADRLVSEFYSAYNAHDAQAAALLYCPDGWHEEINAGRRRDGRENLRAGLDRLFAMLPDVHCQEHQRVRAAASMVVLYTMSGHLAADIGKFPSRGRKITLSGVHVFDLGDDAIKVTRDYWDMSDFTRQIT